MLPTTTVRSQPFNSCIPPSMSSAQLSGRNTGSELSLHHLHDRLNQLRSTVLTKEEYVDRRNLENDDIRREFQTHRATSDRIELNVAALRSDVNQKFHQLNSRMKHSDRVRFNSLAHTISAPINSVPVITDNGALQWPKYFPSTVWKFWCLKKRSRVHRLVELAEFYKLGGYQDWSQMHQADMSAEGDSSDSSDVSFPISREEAVRRFPEAAHQALAATLGLVYYKIRNEVGEGPNVLPSRSLKRQQEDVASASAVRKAEKPIKIPRRPSVSETLLERLVNGPGPFVTESQSSRSEEFDQLGWDVFSGVSEDAMSKLRSIDRQDIGTILRALEQGRLKLKPSESEKARMSPDASPTQLDKSIRKSEVSTEPNTSSQPFSLPSRTAQPTSVPDIPEPASDSDSSTS